MDNRHVAREFEVVLDEESERGRGGRGEISTSIVTVGMSCKTLRRCNVSLVRGRVRRSVAVGGGGRRWWWRRGRERRGSDRGEPCTGTEPGNKVSNSARDGRALTDSTLKGVGTSTEGSGSVDGKGGEGFCDPFHVTSGREANNIEREELKLCREAVEVFFLVLVKVCKNGVFELGDILNCEKIIEGKVGARFARAIGRNGVVKNMGRFDGGGERGVDKGVKVGIEGLKNRDRAFISDTRFVNEGSAGDFKRRRKDASGEDERDERVKSIRPCGVETSKDIKGKAVIAGFSRNSTNSVAQG